MMKQAYHLKERLQLGGILCAGIGLPMAGLLAGVLLGAKAAGTPEAILPMTAGLAVGCGLGLAAVLTATRNMKKNWPLTIAGAIGGGILGYFMIPLLAGRDSAAANTAPLGGVTAFYFVAVLSLCLPRLNGLNREYRAANPRPKPQKETQPPPDGPALEFPLEIVQTFDDKWRCIRDYLLPSTRALAICLAVATLLTLLSLFFSWTYIPFCVTCLGAGLLRMMKFPPGFRWKWAFTLASWGLFILAAGGLFANPVLSRLAACLFCAGADAGYLANLLGGGGFSRIQGMELRFLFTAEGFTVTDQDGSRTELPYTEVTTAMENKWFFFLGAAEKKPFAVAKYLLTEPEKAALSRLVKTLAKPRENPRGE